MNTNPPSINTVLASQDFTSFSLAPEILRAISAQGYTQPTPIQANAIPVILQGQDVMGAAQTGTGKTAAFVLPIIQQLLAFANQSTSPARHPVRALILVPTRELADQVAENANKYACHTDLRIAVVFGGVDIVAQTMQLRAGVEILIATPGRLLDHIQQKTLSLAQVQLLVLDEADRMLDMGFLPDLQRIINLLPQTRQTLLFSATFSAPIRKLANSYLRKPTVIEVAAQNATAENVCQVIYRVSEENKRAAVVHILHERHIQQCIIFCNSKIGCAHLARALVRDGIKAEALHGDRNQNERMQILEAFKNGEVAVLVATDVAARGLDIPAMPCVINFDLPFNAEDYVHRIGRTGRAGATGDAISLYTENDQKTLKDIEKLINCRLSPATLPGLAKKPVAYHPLSTPTEIDPFFTQPYQPSLKSNDQTSLSSSVNATLNPFGNAAKQNDQKVQVHKKNIAALLCKKPPKT